MYLKTFKKVSKTLARIVIKQFVLFVKTFQMKCIENGKSICIDLQMSFSYGFIRYNLYIYFLESIIQASDLENYIVHKKQAASSILRDGSTAYSAPAPSGGVVWIFIMNIMDGELSPFSF